MSRDMANCNSEGVAVGSPWRTVIIELATLSLLKEPDGGLWEATELAIGFNRFCCAGPLATERGFRLLLSLSLLPCP